MENLSNSNKTGYAYLDTFGISLLRSVQSLVKV